MKFTLKQPKSSNNHRIESSLRNSLDALLPLMRIEEARIQLEYVREASPSYRATALLVVPGPDLRAEVVDHTERTAIARLMENLRTQVLGRATKRLQRSAGRGRLPLSLHP